MATQNRLILEDFLPYRLNQAAEKLSRRFAKTYRDRYGLTRPEWRTLATIGQMETTTATEIGRHSAMHKTMVSRAVYALEKRGWLKRTTEQADRRVEQLELTRRGRRAYEDLVAYALDFEAAFESLIGKTATKRLSDGLKAIEALPPAGSAR
jgi:DNA-binding MarR family transcriptional regulator